MPADNGVPKNRNIPRFSVLYVDDEPGLLEITKLFLEKDSEFQVGTALSADEAFSSPQLPDYDAIVSDYQMPGMDGIAFLKAVREQFGDIPFILFTGRGREEVVIDAINNGADFYIQKGSDPRSQFAELAHKVRQAIARRQSEREITSVFRAVPVGIGVIDNRIMVRVNNHLCTITGYPPEELEGQNTRFLYLNDEDYAAAGRMREQVYREGHVDDLEVPWRRKDGTVITVRITAAAIDRSNPLAPMTYSALDITEEKRAREELRSAYEKIAASEEKLRQQVRELAEREREIRISESRLVMAQEIARTGSWEYDFATNEILGSAETLHLFGYRHEAGRVPVEAIESRIREKAENRQALTDLARTGKAYDIEYTIDPADGSPERRVHSVARLEKDAGGRPVRIIGVIQDITDRQRAEQSRSDSEARFRELADLLPQMVFEVTPDLRITYANGQACTEFGLTEPELSAGVSILTFIDPSQHDRMLSTARKQLDQVPVEPQEYTAVRKDGSAFPVISYSSPFYRNGDIAGFRGVVVDISFRRKMEEDLRKKEEQFRRLAEKAPDLIYRMSLPEGKYEYVSPASFALTGYTPEEFYADPMLITRLIHPGWREYLRQQFTALLEGDVPATYEFQIIDRAGRTRWVNQRNVLVRSGTGDLVAIEGIVTDITAQKDAELELRKSERRFLAVTQNAGSWIWEIDPDGLYRYSSPAIERIVGYRPDEVVGKLHFYDLFDPSVREELKEVALAAFGKRDPFRDFINLNRHKDGRLVLLKTSGTPVFDGDGTFAGYSGVDDDITEQKQVEQALRESEERFRGMAERSSDLILILNRSMSPEYVSPSVLSILGFAPEELVGKSPEFAMATIFRETGPGLMNAVEATMGGRLVENVELTVSRKDGIPVYVSLHAVPVLRDGVLEGVQVAMRDITARKLADDALRVSETKFSSIFNSSPVALTLVSAGDGTFVDVNETFLRSSGYTRGEVIGRTAEDLGLFPDRPDLERFVSALVKVQSVRGMEIRCRRKTGENQVCRFTSGIIRMGDQSFILSSVEDVTQLKAAEDALKAMVGSMVGTTGIDSLWKIAENLSSWLSADCVMVGEIQPGRQTVSVLSMILDGKNVTGFSYTLEGTPCENVAERGYCEYPDDTARLFPKSRDLVELNIRGYAGTPLRNSQGSVMGILCVMSRSPLHLSPTVREIIDIIAVKAAAEIERMRMERTLHESEDRFRSFVEISSDILYSMTPEGILTYISPKWAAITGHETGEILGGSFETLVVAEDLPDYRRLLEEVLRGKCGRRVGEYRIRQGDGTLHWHSTNATAIRDADGTITAIAGSIRDVTERKRAEEALRESEEKFRSLIENTNDIIYTLDLTGRITNVSPQISRYGYKPEEIITNNLVSLIIEEDLPAVLADCETTISTGQPTATVFRIRDKAGAIHWLEDNSRAVFDTSGNVIGMSGILRDITDRKRIEDALRESEEKFRSIVETSPNLIWEVDLKGHFQYMSPTVTAILGYTPEEVIGKSIFDLVAEENRSVAEQAFAQVVEPARMPPAFEIPARHRDGHNVILEIRPSLIGSPDEGGRLRGVAIDITERKRAEEVLRKSRHQLAEAMDIAHLADWEYDVATNLFTFNDRFYALYGTSAEREGGMQMSPETYAQEFIHPEDRHLVGEEVGKALNSTDPGYTAHVQHRIIRRDGAVRHILVRIGVILDGNGKVIKTHGANQDITEQIQAEKALARANQQLTLLGSVTRHDTLNKISVILGYLNIAGMKCTDPAVAELLQKIEDNTKVVRSQMEFTRAYQDIGSQEPRWIDLDTVMPRQHLPHAIAFTADMQGISLYADPMLEKVFFNLLDNAIRHGERVTEIRVTSCRVDGDLVVTWEDNGVGVAANEKERIFERGFGRHTGLGMFLVREILALTEITIRETGEPGRGARFEITVPPGMWRSSRNGA